MSIDETITNLQHEEEEEHARDFAANLSLPYINLLGYPVTPDVLAIIKEEDAHQYGLVPYLKAGQTVRVAANDPENPQIKQFLTEEKTKTHLDYLVSYCSKSSLSYGLYLYQKLLPKVKENTVKVDEQEEKNFETEIKSLATIRDQAAKISVTQLLDLFFAGAIKLEASDIHLEPGEKELRVRYRIDGVLQDVVNLPMTAYRNLISRIKFLGQLKLDVSEPQDGRFSIKVEDKDVDIRVATLPTSFGEAVTMRVLPKDKEFQKLDQLGFSAVALVKIKEAISKPQGLILNTGPTGSGKTTTLYAILQELNQPGRKIITLEDPIEYRIEGIEQVQVKHEKKEIELRKDPHDIEKNLVEDEKMSFLDALKGCLRQDPDILMVGEIRDKETAEIALQASMTGHLVLSTLHTTSAPAAYARLLDLSVEPYQMAGTINLIIAQRLVRKIHRECGGKGCEVCHNSGYKGRLAIVEVLEPNSEMEKLVLAKTPLRELEAKAKELGLKTMYEDGMGKVAAGLTTKEEVERVTKE